MASKYKRGKRIKTIADYYKSTEKGQRMFWIYHGRWLVRHIGWIESLQYRTLKMFIEHYHLYEAVLKEDEDE